jgi:hypothetical protein
MLVNITKDEEIMSYLNCGRDESKHDHVNLLLFKDEEKSHYIYINDMARLVGNQISKNEHHFFVIY